MSKPNVSQKALKSLGQLLSAVQSRGLWLSDFVRNLKSEVDTLRDQIRLLTFSDKQLDAIRTITKTSATAAFNEVLKEMQWEAIKDTALRAYNSSSDHNVEIAGLRESFKNLFNRVPSGGYHLAKNDDVIELRNEINKAAGLSDSLDGEISRVLSIAASAKADIENLENRIRVALQGFNDGQHFRCLNKNKESGPVSHS